MKLVRRRIWIAWMVSGAQRWWIVCFLMWTWSSRLWSSFRFFSFFLSFLTRDQRILNLNHRCRLTYVSVAWEKQIFACHVNCMKCFRWRISSFSCSSFKVEKRFSSNFISGSFAIWKGSLLMICFKRWFFLCDVRCRNRNSCVLEVRLSP